MHSCMSTQACLALEEVMLGFGALCVRCLPDLTLQWKAYICLNSVPRSASKMHQSAGLHKESRVCVPVTGLNANAQCQAVHCNAAQCNAVLCTRKVIIFYIHLYFTYIYFAYICLVSRPTPQIWRRPNSFFSTTLVSKPAGLQLHRYTSAGVLCYISN